MKKPKEEILENKIIKLRQLRKKDEKNYNELKKEITKIKKELLKDIEKIEMKIKALMYVGDKKWNKKI